MKHPLDSFVDFLERTTPSDICILCQGTGKILYAGNFVRCFEGECYLCKGTGKRKTIMCDKPHYEMDDEELRQLHDAEDEARSEVREDDRVMAEMDRLERENATARDSKVEEELINGE